jgi:hypothetical protein
VPCAGATDVLETHALPRVLDSGRLAQAAKVSNHAVRLTSKASSIKCRESNVMQLHNELAEMLENEGQNEEAITHFNKAADFFLAENSASSAQKCKIRAAKLYAKVWSLLFTDTGSLGMISALAGGPP